MEHDGGAAMAWSLETWYEVRDAVKWCVQHGLKGKKDDPLPEGLSAQALQAINADIYGFMRWVERERTGQL